MTMKRTYSTITGRSLDLSGLGREESEFLAAVRQRYGKAPEWSEFAAWWAAEFHRLGLPQESPVYRVCQDLEARLGIAQGKVATPDYRDYLTDLIEERYGSRYRFCKETGVDPGHLFVDYAEIDSLLAGLDYIAQLDKSSTVLEKLEAVYRTQGTLEITRFDTSRGPMISVSSGRVPRVRAFFPASALKQLRDLFASAKVEIDRVEPLP